MEERSTARHLRSVSQDGPRVYMVENFLNDDECSLLTGLTHMPHANLSSSHDNGFEEWKFAEGNLGQDPKLLSISDRILSLANLPLSFQLEPDIRIMHFRSGEFERPQLYAQAAIVIRVFLTSVEQGGEIIFSRSDPGETQAPYACDGDMARCCSGEGLKVRAQLGDAVLMYTYAMDGKVDWRSEHATCPVQAGESWVAEFRFVFPVNWPAKQAKLNAAPTGVLSVEFDNVLGKDVSLLWVDNGQNEVPMGEILAGTSRVFNSYVGHTFMAREKEGAKMLQMFRVGPESKQRMVIGDTLGNDVEGNRPSPEL